MNKTTGLAPDLDISKIVTGLWQIADMESEGQTLGLDATAQCIRAYADAGDWEPVSRAHGERFAHIQPANTLVQARLNGDDYLVEIEAEAITGSGP